MSIAVCLGVVVKMSLCLKCMLGVGCVGGGGGVGGQAMLKQLGPAPQGFESVSRHVFIGSQGARAHTHTHTHARTHESVSRHVVMASRATYNSFICIEYYMDILGTLMHILIM
jgi:hypothetical protein